MFAIYIIQGFFAIGLGILISMIIYCLVDDIRLRRIEKYLKSIGYKGDWIYIKEVDGYYRGFRRVNPYNRSISETIVYRDINGLSLKEIKEKYQ